MDASEPVSSTPDFITITAPSDAVGQRLDVYLSTALEEISRTRIKRSITDGDVLVNDRAVKPSYRLRARDVIEIDLPEPPPVEISAEPIPISIVYEDDDLAVIDKPSGLVVHPGAGVHSGTLANALMHHFNQLSQAAGEIRPGIVHRLDRETSGLMVVAKNAAAHERLSAQFSDRRITKKYVALVYGRIQRDRDEIIARIGRSSRNRTRMAVVGEGRGRFAHSIFKVARRLQEFTLVDVWIKTGRTHQIRVHLAHIGHPVAGDIAYGLGREKQGDPAVRRELIKLERFFLHSAELGFAHPTSGDRMLFTSDLPADLADFLEKLK